MGKSTYPTELLEKAKYEQHMFDRVASDTGKELIQEVERLRLLVALHVAPVHVAAMAAVKAVTPSASGDPVSPVGRPAAASPEMATVTANEAASTDTLRLDWLDKNFHHDEKDNWDATRHEGFSKWKFFAPEGVGNDIRRVIDASIAHENAPQSKAKNQLASI